MQRGRWAVSGWESGRAVTTPTVSTLAAAAVRHGVLLIACRCQHLHQSNQLSSINQFVSTVNQSIDQSMNSLLYASSKAGLQSYRNKKNSIIHHTVNCLKNSKWKFLSVNKLQNRWLKEHVNLRDNVLLMPSSLNMLPFPVAKNQVFHKKNKFRLLHSLHFFACNKSIVRRVYIGDSKCGKWSIVRGLVQGIKKVRYTNLNFR